MHPLFGFLPHLGMQEILIILAIGVLLFGRKLPEVGRYLGKGIVEFKKGLKGMEDDVEGSVAKSGSEPAAMEPPRPPQRVAATAPKFQDTTTNASTSSPPGV